MVGRSDPQRSADLTFWPHEASFKDQKSGLSAHASAQTKAKHRGKKIALASLMLEQVTGGRAVANHTEDDALIDGLLEVDDLEVVEEPQSHWCELASQVGAVAQQWRARLQVDDSATMSALDAWVEDFILKVARAVEAGQESPDWAWSNSRGLLRLPLRDGAMRLESEFDTLLYVLREWAQERSAPPWERRRMDALVLAAQQQALLHLNARLGLERQASVPFGGLIVEVP
jgi:hypothetical protein